jgi:hypothetical protein
MVASGNGRGSGRVMDEPLKNPKLDADGNAIAEQHSSMHRA